MDGCIGVFEVVKFHTKRHRARKTQSFKIRASKPLIDRIDTELGKLLGLNQEETDFIINYDIKYRMGGTDDEE